MSQTNLVLPPNEWGYPDGHAPYVVVESDGSVALLPVADREAWPTGQIPVTPGQTVTAQALIRTDSLPAGYVPPTPWSNGARIGLDFRDASGTIIRAVYANVPPYPNPNPWNNAANPDWVDWGSPWSLRKIQTTVHPGEVNVVMWCQCMNDLAPANGYFASAELYISSPAAQTIQIQVVSGAGAQGQVNPNGLQTLTVGKTYQFTAKPAQGYQLKEWDLSGTSLGTSNPLSLTVTADMNGQTLTAYFFLQRHRRHRWL